MISRKAIGFGSKARRVVSNKKQPSSRTKTLCYSRRACMVVPERKPQNQVCTEYLIAIPIT
jgi:hypothetical protein